MRDASGFRLGRFDRWAYVACALGLALQVVAAAALPSQYLWDLAPYLHAARAIARGLDPYDVASYPALGLGVSAQQAALPFVYPPHTLFVLAPLHALTRASVTHIVRAALLRAGVKAPINGAHVLRHSSATTMLRQGASLAGVGAVLRHRSPTTTAHYAKVDFGLLSEIAQPWPEVSSC